MVSPFKRLACFAILIAALLPSVASAAEPTLNIVGTAPSSLGRTTPIAIGGDWVLLQVQDTDQAIRWNFKTGETQTINGVATAWDMVASGVVLYSPSEAPGDYKLWWYGNVVDAPPVAEGASPTRLSIDVRRRVPQGVNGVFPNRSGTLKVSLNGDVFDAAGNPVSLPGREGNLGLIARDVPLLYARPDSAAQNDSLLRLDLRTGVSQIIPIPNYLAFFATSAEGNYVAAQIPGNPTVQTVIIRFDTGISVQAAASVNEIVFADDYNPGSHAEVLRLYQAIFGRWPDLAGAKYWIRTNNGTENGTTYNVLEIAGFMSGSPEWANAYSGTTDAQFVEIVYSNVLGRGYDQGGYNYWLDLVRGTNQHEGNKDLAKLARHEMVFYVTANPESISGNPFQP